MVLLLVPVKQVHGMSIMEKNKKNLFYPPSSKWNKKRPRMDMINSRMIIRDKDLFVDPIMGCGKTITLLSAFAVQHNYYIRNLNPSTAYTTNMTKESIG